MARAKFNHGPASSFDSKKGKRTTCRAGYSNILKKISKSNDHCERSKGNLTKVVSDPKTRDASANNLKLEEYLYSDTGSVYSTGSKAVKTIGLTRKGSNWTISIPTESIDAMRGGKKEADELQRSPQNKMDQPIKSQRKAMSNVMRGAHRLTNPEVKNPSPSMDSVLSNDYTSWSDRSEEDTSSSFDDQSSWSKRSEDHRLSWDTSASSASFEEYDPDNIFTPPFLRGFLCA